MRLVRPVACPARLEARPHGVVGLHGSSRGPREGTCHGEAPVREARAGDACRRCVSEVWLCVGTCSFAATAECPLLSERPSDGEPWAHMPATPAPPGPRGRGGSLALAPRSGTVTLRTAARGERAEHGDSRCPTTRGRWSLDAAPAQGAHRGPARHQLRPRACLLGQPPAMGAGSTQRGAWGWSQSPRHPRGWCRPEAG